MTRVATFDIDEFYSVVDKYDFKFTIRFSSLVELRWHLELLGDGIPVLILSDRRKFQIFMKYDGVLYVLPEWSKKYPELNFEIHDGYRIPIYRTSLCRVGVIDDKDVVINYKPYEVYRSNKGVNVYVGW